MAKGDDLFHQRVGMFTQQFLQEALVLIGKVLRIGEQQIAMLPKFLVQSRARFALGGFTARAFECFAIGRQGFVQMAMDVLDDMKEVVLNLRVGKDRANGWWIGRPEIHIDRLDLQTQHV